MKFKLCYVCFSIKPFQVTDYKVDIYHKDHTVKPEEFGSKHLEHRLEEFLLPTVKRIDTVADDRKADGLEIVGDRDIHGQRL